MAFGDEHAGSFVGDLADDDEAGDGRGLDLETGAEGAARRHPAIVEISHAITQAGARTTDERRSGIERAAVRMPVRHTARSEPVYDDVAERERPYPYREMGLR